MTTISVVIPTCDRPHYLVEAVDCVIEQSHPADEIMVVNNGRVALNEGLLPEQITIQELPPYVGVSRARNQGAAVTSSDYIAFLDDDDLWELDYLRKALEVIKEQQPDCIITRLDQLKDGQILSGKNAAGKLDLATLLVRNPGVVGPATVVRREAFVHVGGYDQALKTGEDKALIIELLHSGYSVTGAPHIQAIMRVHNNSRLSDAKSMQEGLYSFIQKYGGLMSLAQKNYNWTKIHYYRYLTTQKRNDYYLYRLRYKLHSFFRKRDPNLPVAPVL